jgi:hypothetical protein
MVLETRPTMSPLPAIPPREPHPPVPSRPGRSARRGALFLAAVAAFALAAAGDPEVVPVHVPAKDVSKWFPPGTEQRTLSPKDFEARVEAARRASAARRPIAPPRVIRARHRARWAANMLTGHTELVLGPLAVGPSECALAPWTPTILAATGQAGVVGARDSGTAVVSVDASPREQTIILDWELLARPHSHGRGFTLGLPSDETTVLELDLPKGWIASSQRGIRRRPNAAEAPERALWEIDGESGRFDVELRDPKSQGEMTLRSGAWVSGTTEVDLRRTTGRAGELVNWITEWRVELDPRHPRQLEAKLDPGLELIDVQGPAVRGYRIDRTGPATRVTVALDGESSAASVRFLAHDPVRPEGTWRIPAMQPVDATWTRGRTTVILDELHVVRECLEESGRLVAPGRTEAPGVNRLTFEAESPRSVGQLVFLGPRAELSCGVRGQLFLTGGQARFDCRLDWTLQRGSSPELEVDLSPAWVPEQVQIQGLDDPVAWHPSALSSGATRLRVLLPAAELSRKKWAMTIRASSTVAGGRGPLELPRVRAVGAATVDEAWLAWGDDGTTIRPVRAEGLSWIDPMDVPGLPSQAAGTNLREALAWRWTADEAEARVDRERNGPQPSASIRARARISPDGRARSIEGTLLIGSGVEPLDSFPLWIDGSDDALASWRFRDEAGVALATRPIEATERARLGLPRAGSSRGLIVNMAAQAEKAIRFEASSRRETRGPIPLLSAPGEFFRRGTILVETPAGMRSRTESTGLGRISPSVVAPARTAQDAEDAALVRGDRSPSQYRDVHAFSYKQPGARLELFTEPLMPATATGVIREAVLTTTVDVRGRSLNRLRLLVHLEPTAPLELAMPARSSLVRVRSDGVEVDPIRSDSRLFLPAPGPARGARSSTILVDYAMDGLTIADGGRLRPSLPEIGLPCLSFVWEIAAPSSWKAMDCGPGLIANDRDDPNGWPCGPLGLWRPAWDFLRGPAASSAVARLGALDGQLEQGMPDELTFAEWFTRWDSGRWPLVIDRLALNSAGLGPKSPCIVGRSRSDRRGISLAMLQQHGLTAVPFPDVLLITTEAEAASFAVPGRWVGAIGETLAWGSDRTDRFQTPARWRGEASPRSASASGDEAAERFKPPPGWATWRFSAADWPGSDSSVRLVDVRRRILMGWMAFAGLALAWLCAGGRFSRGRLLIPAVLSAACVLLDAILPSRFAGVMAGCFASGLAILIVELGRRLRRSPEASPVAARSPSSINRLAARSAVGASLALVIGGAIGSLRAGPPEDASPIVALLPYEGAFDPARPPDRVILRLADFKRLTRLAVGEPSNPATVTAVSASHRVERADAQSIIVESQFELVARGRAPFSWKFPVSFARDIGATLDGATCPIAIEPGGTRAEVVIPAAGNHVLRLRRSVATLADEAGPEAISLPINPMPTARILVERPRDGVAQGTLVARGLIEHKADGTLSGRLGPADRIVIRWSKPGPPAPPRKVGSVEGMALWDVNPAGDRLRARLTYHMPRELSTIRLSHDPGLILRSVQAPGRSEVFFEDSQDGQWILSIDPPLPPGATLAIDCWRPWDAAPGDAGSPPTTPGRSGEVVREIPKIQPVGVERFSGALGMRRPGDWTGRLEPRPGIEPIHDEAFVKAWGNLTDEPLTLSGTSRFSGQLVATLHTGLTASRVQVRPAVQVRLESGRIVVTVDAELVELSGHFPLTEAELPEGIRVTQVSGDGLMDWTISADHHLHLIWQRPGSSPRRHLRISGWIPLPEEPLKVGSRPHRARVPWFGWGTAEAAAGSLLISSNVRVEVQGSAGLTPVPTNPEPVPTGAAGPASRTYTTLEYQVNDPGRLGEMRWDPPPPRVAVTIESQMTLYADFAEWVAVLRYDVSGGALDAIHLKLPAAWAAQATLHPSGEDFQITSETRGPSSFWSITPRRPFWGSHRFVLRSTLPLTADREIVYPDLAPLGNNGAFDAYLGIVNATGHPLISEGLTGLDMIDYATRFQDKEFARDVGTPDRAFHVRKNPWVLRTQLPRGIPESGGSQDHDARIASADLAMTVLPDRTIIGRAVYETVPDSGHLLTIQLPAGTSISWAAVDSNPTVPLQSGPEAWSIVLDGRREERICVIWKTGPAASPAPRSGSWSIAIPRAGLGTSRSLLGVFTSSGVSVEGIPAGFEPASMARIELARADGIAQSIGSFLRQLDRSSGRDHERLVSLLIGHELALRSAERGTLWNESGRTQSPDDSARERIAKARGTVNDAVSSAGLRDDLASALGYLGESKGGLDRPTAGIPEPIALGRIRTFGQPTGMLGTAKGIDDASPPAALTLQDASPGLPPNQTDDGLPMVVLLLPGAALAATLASGYRSAGAGAMAIVLGAAAYIGGPTLLAGGLGLAAFAWHKGGAARG